MNSDDPVGQRSGSTYGMSESTTFSENPAVGVQRTRKEDWEAACIGDTPVGVIGFQGHGDTVPEALRSLADRMEGSA